MFDPIIERAALLLVAGLELAAIDVLVAGGL